MTTIDDITLDALLKESVSERVTTTDHPVEEGSDPTDHVRVLPIVLTIEGVLTNTPIPQADREERGNPQAGLTTGYAQRAYEKLRALKFGRLVVVQTPARRYENMQITEIARGRDSSLGTDTIQFTVQLKEIVIVSTQSVVLERVTAPTSVPKQPTGKDKQGKETPEPVDDRSQAKKLFDAGGITTRGDGYAPR